MKEAHIDMVYCGQRAPSPNSTGVTDCPPYESASDVDEHIALFVFQAIIADTELSKQILTVCGKLPCQLKTCQRILPELARSPHQEGAHNLRASHDP